jgi:hypothetical protein
LDLQVLVIAKNDREQVFVMQEFAQRVLVLQRVPVLQRVLVLKQLAQKLQVQPQLSVSEELHHVVLLQLVHSMKKLLKKMMNPKSLGYMF